MYRTGFLLLILAFQDQGGLQLDWAIPHDRAAVFSMVDGANGSYLREFWLLGCELDGRIDALHATEVPLRYALRTPKEKLRPGFQWTIKERLFCDFPGALAPIEIVGTCRVRQSKPITLEEVFKATFKGRKEKTLLPEAIVIDSQYQVFRGNWVNDAPVSFERNASATFSTVTVFRPTDSAILGASFQWNGRAEEYSGNYSAPSVARRSLSRELVFKDTYIELTKAGLKDRIDKAVEKGSIWLRTTQTADGKFTEPLNQADKWAYAKEYLTALSLMALTHSGAANDDKAITRGFGYLEGRRLFQVWDVGLTLMALESKYFPASMYEDILTYSEEKAREQIAKKISQKDKAQAEQLVSVLIACQGKSGGFGYSDPTVENIQTTQYALLGLKSAARLGARVPASVWRGTIKYLEDSLNSSGNSELVKLSYLDGRKDEEKTAFEYGWIYRPLAERRPTTQRHFDTNGIRVMSALACVAICRSELVRLKILDDDLQRKLDDLKWGGLAWWARHPGLRAPQQEGCLEMAALTYFYQWSTERAAVYLGIERINGHSWYFEGAAHILSAQHPDGHWDGSRGLPIVDTACALLFLKRATIPVETPAGTGKKAVATEGEKKPATTDPEK